VEHPIFRIWSTSNLLIRCGILQAVKEGRRLGMQGALFDTLQLAWRWLVSHTLGTVSKLDASLGYLQ
jgi:hypothetical protein